MGFQEISTISCTRFLAIFVGFEGIQTWHIPQGSMERFPFGPRYNTLGAGAISVEVKSDIQSQKMLSNNNSTHIVVKILCVYYMF